MDDLEGIFTWVLMGLLAVGIVAAAIIWLPSLQRQAAPTPAPPVAVSPTALLAQATPPSASPTAVVGPSASPTAARPTSPTATPRPAGIPTPRAEEASRTPVTPLGSAVKSNASRTASSVNAFAGTYSYSFTDAATAGGAALTFTRTYNSDDSRGSDLGPGWTHSFAYRLEPASAGSQDRVLVGLAGGRQRFARRADGTFAAPPGSTSDLKATSDGFTLTIESGDVWTFGADGTLTAVSDGDGAATTLTYGSGVPWLLRISDPDGRGSLALDHDLKTGRLLSVADWLDPPRVVSFGYDTQGRLASVTDREGKVTRYTYHGNGHLLASIVDARGKSVATVTYDDKGRVSSLKDARGKTTGQAQTLSYRVSNDGSVETTRTLPPSGLESGFRPTVVESFAATGLLMKRVTKPTSGGEALAEEFGYAADGTLTSITRQGGATSRPQAPPSSAQSSGLSLLDLTRPQLLRSLLEALERIESGSLVHLEDGFGRVSAFEAPVDMSNPFVRNGVWMIGYDAEDRVRFVMAPQGEQPKPQPGRASAPGPRLAAPTPVPLPDLELRYDEVGNLVEVLEPDGKATRYRYDDRNLLIEARSSTGIVHEFAYDERGDPASAKVTSGGKQRAAEYAFDGLRRLRRVTDYPSWPDRSRSVVAETVYDGRGGSSVVIYQR